MELKQLLADDDAVSPVIGVILMVAITVILAAVIGTFVLGIGENQQTTPSASWDYDYNSNASNLTITHEGGDSFTDENTNNLTVTNGTVLDYAGNGNFSLPVSAGDEILTNGNVAAGDTVRIIWEANGGGTTQTVGSFDVPS